MENLVKQILGQLSDFRFRAWPKNWLLKLMSLIFAVFLWYFVVGEDKVDYTVTVPIEIVNLPRDLIVSNQYKKELEVTISGPRGLVRGISKQNISRPVDLSKAHSGKIIIRHETDDIPFSRSIKVLRIQPANTTLRLEKIITKTLPFKAITHGELAEGLELLSMRLSPSSVETTGSENILGNVFEINTNPIDLTGITAPTTKQASLNLSHELAALIGDIEVEAQITVREKYVKLDISTVLVEFNHHGKRTTYHLDPPGVNVQAEIPYFLLKKTETPSSLIVARVEADSLPPGTHELDITVTGGGGGVRVVDFTPKRLTMTISEEQTVKKRKPLVEEIPVIQEPANEGPLPTLEKEPTE